MTKCYKCGTELRSTSETVGLCSECMYKAIPYKPQLIGTAKTSANKGETVMVEPATCPDCDDPIALHDEHGCHAEPIAGGICECKRTPADLQPEKHCTLPDGHIMAGGLCQHCPQTTEGCQYWQPTPTMPLREQFTFIVQVLHNLCQNPDCPICKESIKQLESAVEAHDSEVASKAVKEFAEKVIATMPVNNQVKKQRVLMIAHIRAMAGGGA